MILQIRKLAKSLKFKKYREDCRSCHTPLKILQIKTESHGNLQRNISVSSSFVGEKWR